jgi:hypothetical protein
MRRGRRVVSEQLLRETSIKQRRADVANQLRIG